MGLEHDPGRPTIGDFDRAMVRAGISNVRFYRGIAGWFAGATLKDGHTATRNTRAMVTGCHPTLGDVMLELMAWAETLRSARTGGA